MELTYMAVVAAITFILAEALKNFNFYKKYLPLVNLGVGIVSAVICYFTGILPNGTLILFIEALGMCIMASLTAGGAYDVFAIGKKKGNENG